MRGLRTRLALWITPWLEQPPVVRFYPPVITTSTAVPTVYWSSTTPGP